MARCGIALGSNVGDRLGRLRDARDRIAQSVADPPGADAILASPAYESAPVDCPDGSPPFLNAVIEIGFGGSPLDLLDSLRAIESGMGREPVGRRVRNGPRVIDLDLLYVDDLVLTTPALTLPHPRMVRRRFVLQPLADIRPELVLPGEAGSVLDLLAALQSDEPPLVLRTALW